MKHVKKPVLVFASLAVAGLLAMPAFAQQEVSPDHFDDHPAAAQGKKPVAHKNTGSSAKQVVAADKSKSKPTTVETAVLKADVNKGQANPR